jgi:hypothetical protein
VQSTPGNKAKLLHRVAPDGYTVEFFLTKIDEIIEAQESLIPFDDPVGWSDWIKRGVESGGLSYATVFVNGNAVGFVTWVIENSGRVPELLISSASITSFPDGLDFADLITTFGIKICRQTNVEHMRFHTARKGLVKKCLNLGWRASEVVMRMKIPAQIKL